MMSAAYASGSAGPVTVDPSRVNVIATARMGTSGRGWSDYPRPPAHPGPGSLGGEEVRRLERVGRGDDERIRQLEGPMGCAQVRRSLCNIGTDRFDAKGEVSDELARRVHRGAAAASRPDEHLGICAGREDHVMAL